MNPRTMLRSAALTALAAAAGSSDPDYAPLGSAQVSLGATWPSQSSTAGAPPMPNQLLVYGWDEESETVAEKTTADQFETTLTLVVEARVEVPGGAQILPTALTSPPNQAAIDAAVDGALDALCFAVKKAICEGIRAAATALNDGTPVITGIKKIATASKYAETGQRVLGNGGVAFDITFGEHFDAPITTDLSDVVILIGAAAGGVANEGNHGNGTISAVTVGLAAEPGAYAVAFTSATAFNVTKPDSTSAGSGAVGALFSGGGIAFTITAGTTPFISGDGFTVSVEVAAETILNPS